MKSLKALSNNEYIISVFIHVSLLLILMLLTFKLPVSMHEVALNWETEDKQVIENQTIPDEADELTDAPKNSSPAISATDAASLQIRPGTNADTDDDILLPMPLTVSKNTKAEVVNPVSDKHASGFLNRLKSRLSGSGKGGSSFELDEGESSLKVLYKVLPEADIKDYGKVTLQFRIKSDGTVYTESIVPVQIDASGYAAPAVNALKQWKFAVSGTHNPNKKYSISFIFKPE